MKLTKKAVAIRGIIVLIGILVGIGSVYAYKSSQSSLEQQVAELPTNTPTQQVRANVEAPEVSPSVIPSLENSATPAISEIKVKNTTQVPQVSTVPPTTSIPRPSSTPEPTSTPNPTLVPAPTPKPIVCTENTTAIAAQNAYYNAQLNSAQTRRDDGIAEIERERQNDPYRKSGGYNPTYEKIHYDDPIQAYKNQYATDVYTINVENQKQLTLIPKICI